MKKTFVTTMPDHVGAFLLASRCFAALEANITRVSYNKAVDTHTLFIEAEGTEQSLQDAEQALREIGYLTASPAGGTAAPMGRLALRYTLISPAAMNTSPWAKLISRRMP